MQAITLSAQLALGSKLVDWYRDATSTPHGQLLIDLPPRKIRSTTLLHKHSMNSFKVFYP